MEDKRYTEQDWKLFRKKIANWQESYIDKLNHEYIEILTGDGNPSDKFWQLDKRIREDRRTAGVSVEMRRSVLVSNILSLLAEGAITIDDLDDFSDTLKEAVTRAMTYLQMD